MENKNESMQEKGMLVLLAISPIVIGFFYYVMLQLPVIGALWMYAAPFTVLYYWGWVAIVFRSHFKSFWKTMLAMNGLGLVMYVIYIWQMVFTPAGSQIAFLAILSQFYTVSLEFITMWIGILVDGETSLDAETVSTTVSAITETAAILLMILSSMIGYMVGKSQDKKAQLLAEETALEEEAEEMEPVFSDRELEEYELKNHENEGK